MSFWSIQPGVVNVTRATQCSEYVNMQTVLMKTWFHLTSGVSPVSGRPSVVPHLLDGVSQEVGAILQTIQSTMIII